MAFGIYFHIPYCLKRCLYCDFSSFETAQIFPLKEYSDLVVKEIDQLSPFVPQREISSIYFGGGTPSLLSPEIIGEFLAHLRRNGFSWKDSAEISLEANPGTLSLENVTGYAEHGVNRISIGAQSFSDKFLKTLGRSHDREKILDCVKILKEMDLRWSLDLIFGLPGQSKEDLDSDLKDALELGPKHVSAYCLTLPEGHALNQGRPSDEIQAEMFAQIENEFLSAGLKRYEISNFATPGDESRHNLLYWKMKPYWGIGLGAHSYFQMPPYGIRTWNPPTPEGYKKRIEGLSELSKSHLQECFEGSNCEVLKEHQALTDYCHVSFRLHDGLKLDLLRAQFSEKTLKHLSKPLKNLLSMGLIEPTEKGWKATSKGWLFSNQIFQELTFLETDLLE